METDAQPEDGHRSSRGRAWPDIYYHFSLLPSNYNKSLLQKWVIKKVIYEREQTKEHQQTLEHSFIQHWRWW